MTIRWVAGRSSVLASIIDATVHATIGGCVRRTLRNGWLQAAQGGVDARCPKAFKQSARYFRAVFRSIPARIDATPHPFPTFTTIAESVSFLLICTGMDLSVPRG